MFSLGLASSTLKLPGLVSLSGTACDILMRRTYRMPYLGRLCEFLGSVGFISCFYMLLSEFAPPRAQHFAAM